MNDNKGLRFVDIFSSILKHWVRIFSVSILIGLLTLSILFLLPNSYTSQSLLVPSKELNATESGGGAGLLGSFGGGIASTLGFDIGMMPETEKIYLAQQIITSRDFLRHLLTFDGVAENIYAFSSYNSSSEESEFKSDIFDKEKNEWKVQLNDYGVPNFETAYKKYIALIDLKLNLDGNFLRVRVTHKNPHFAFRLNTLIIEEMNFLEKSRNLSLANVSLEYLENEIENYRFRELQDSIYFLIENQLKEKMYSSTRKEYLLTIIDSPFFPEEKSSPARGLLTLLSLVLSFISSCVFFIIRDFDNS